jgi:hypothetical protein
MSAGAYWTWAQGNANVSYWNYSLDSRRIGAASYDSAGRGLDASVSAYRGPVSVHAGVSYRHLDDMAPASQALDKSYDAYLSLTYKPSHFPDIILDGGVGRYGYDSRVYGTTSDTNYWSATLGLEFSKFLTAMDSKKQSAPKGDINRSPSLRLFYRYFDETNHGSVGVTPGNSHFLGMLFRTRIE